MRPEYIYFIKVNVAIAIFYLFYKLFFAGDTLWKARRVYLMLTLIASFAYPMWLITDWLQQQPVALNMIRNYATLPELVVTPESHSFNFWLLIPLGYGIVAFVLTVKLVVQMISIAKIHAKGKPMTINDQEIIALDEEIAPFSFLQHIYINPTLHTADEIKQILTHETAHVRQIHTLDVIVSELVCILCWINPAAWFVKREIRQNLEFLADQQVLSSGFDSRHYQYHLLQLSYQAPNVKLGNRFNVSPLKKRILMMNQKKSNKSTGLKYLLVVPLTLSLVVLSNAETLASTAKTMITQQITAPESTTLTPAMLNENTVSVIDNKKQDVKPTKLVVAEVKDGQTDNPVFLTVEKMPQFPGGDQALFKFLSENIKYPVNAQKNGVQGRVIVQFIVRKDGTISDVAVIRSVDSDLDAEAIRVVNAMPAWIPGQQKGQAVNVKYTLPISFKLDNDDAKSSNNTVNKMAVDGKTPLYIVNGKETSSEDINNLSPDKIKSINVLKGPSAEIYGDKGKNGVIVITLK